MVATDAACDVCAENTLKLYNSGHRYARHAFRNAVGLELLPGILEPGFGCWDFEVGNFQRKRSIALENTRVGPGV